MVIIMNISEEKRTQICAALAKAQQDIKRIQAAGATDNSPEVERICRGTGITGTAGLLSCCAALRPAAGGDVGVGQLGAGAVNPSAGGLGKLRKALAGGFQADGGIGGVRPGCRLGEIPFLPPAYITFSGTLHLVDLILGVQFAVVLDVPGVQLLQALLRPGGRVAQLRKHGEKGVAAVPAAQPGTPKSGCMILPEICTDNSGKIQKRR